MNTATAHYTSPVTRPTLRVRAPSPEPPAALPPVVCLHCGAEHGHAAPRLVSFEWGRVATPLWRR